MSWQRLIPNGQAVPEAGGRRSWAGVVAEQPPKGFTSRDRFLRAFFILEKKTRKLAAWTEKMITGFLLIFISGQNVAGF